MLQEYVLISLDIFLKIPHNSLERLDAWLYFIASDSLEDIRKAIGTYPEFRSLYQEIFQFRYHAKELVGMFSEALRILDANTTQYMIDEMQKELEALRKKDAEQAKELRKKDEELEAAQEEVRRLKAFLENAEAKK